MARTFSGYATATPARARRCAEEEAMRSEVSVGECVECRMGKLKEQREMSDMRKLMNRRQFGVAAQNYADDAIGLEYGMLEARKGDIRRVVAKKMKMRFAWMRG